MGKKIDPIPEEFNSYEEAAEFWDIHDVQTDYSGKKIHPSEYEKILNDPDDYIKKLKSGK